MRFAIVALLALVFTGAASAQDIYVVNHSFLEDASVRAALPAFQAAADRDFSPAWNATVTLKFLPGADTQAPQGSWWIELTDTPDCYFCAGYHDVAGGVPYAVVGTPPDDQKSWQITLTHELWEMLADPFINRGMLVKVSKSSKPAWWALETADPVEGDAFAFQEDGVWISDFVLESWFRRGSVGPWDFTHHTSHPLQLLKDGYQLVWNGKTWTQRFPRGVS